jgi:gluconate 2-dehydrogenase gamma chain
MTDLVTRRAVLRAALAAGAAWAAADLAQVDEALAWAAQQTVSSDAPRVTTLTIDQGITLDALTARLIPSVDGRPGAHEAGAVYFIDKSLGTFNAGERAAYDDGLRDLNRRASERTGGQATFASLPVAQQDEIIRQIEKTPFFQAVRFDTIIGTFAVPDYGGNRNHAGWQMLGLEHQPRFEPPFGYYDASVNRKG